ncbi:hypothetical protein LIPSTDRAFT_4661 [Lipomyces starkeyi NRRL Y-11557]|uniref:HAT C-terminal dimerisation domain-containing protein n=1 Tax=Lipomyces starkeyi NRRL Y-11557 TaxID=675824 RepID=A0A1E3Q167_LIPST|nr:hypothetical protein LIPSTDRAFT_4661 [Lipomyces starkeyi NRRL Y-11557]
MLDFWLEEYKSIAISVPTHSSESTSRAKNSFQEWAEKKKASSLEQDEYTKYLLARVLPEVTDPKLWWLEPTQRKSYPALSIMALDVLSIPAMSAEPERLFSSAKRIDTIEAIECLKSWLGKDGTVAFADSAVDMSSSDSNEERI